MIEIYEGDYFQADLDFIKSNPLYTAGDDNLILAFLVQLSESDDAKWSMTKWRVEHSNPHFNISAISSMQKLGFNCYRIRPLSKRLKKYRILYAYNGHIDEVYLLAIVFKKPDTCSILNGEYYDYEPNHRITQRMLNEYCELGLPKLH